jgi:hypothetical protein
MKELKRLKSSEIKEFKLELLEKQGNVDAITHKPLRPENSVLDHQHRLNKQQPLGEDGAGCIRGVLDNNVNMCEGKIFNAMRRYCGIKTTAERIEFLQQLIEYYKSGTLDVVHPSEKIPEKKVSKLNYNKLKKEFEKRYKKKFPEYPKSGKLTKALDKYFKEFGINPYNS